MDCQSETSLHSVSTRYTYIAGFHPRIITSVVFLSEWAAVRKGFQCIPRSSDSRHLYYRAVVRCVRHLLFSFLRWLRFLLSTFPHLSFAFLHPLLGFNGVILISYSWTSMIHSKCPLYSSTVIQPDGKKKMFELCAVCLCRIQSRGFQTNCQKCLAFNTEMSFYSFCPRHGSKFLILVIILHHYNEL